MTKKDKVTVDDIIGLVDCEPTNSVEEVRKLRGRTNERFIVDTAGTLIDMVTRNTYDYVSDVCHLLNELNNENKQLRNDCSILVQSNQNYRKENEQLKDFIRKEFPKSHKHILEGFE